MKKIFSLLLIITSLALNAIGQDSRPNKTPDEKAKIQTNWMKQQLFLDTITSTKAYDINLKYVKKIENIKNSNISKMSKFKEAKNIANQKDNELKAIFSKSQYELYAKKKEELRAYMEQKTNEKH